MILYKENSGLYVYTLVPTTNSGDIYAELHDIRDRDNINIISGELDMFNKGISYSLAVWRFVLPDLTNIKYVFYGYLNNELLAVKPILTTDIERMINIIYDLEYNRTTFIRSMNYKNLIPDITNMIVYRNDTVSFTFNITDSEGAPVDLTNYDVYLSTQLLQYDPAVSGNNLLLSIIDPTNGSVSGEFYVGKEGRYKAQIVLINKANNKKQTITEFDIYVKEDFYTIDSDETLPFK